MQLTRFYMTALLVLGSAVTAVAQDKRQETQTIESKAEKVLRARFVDFGGELGLALPSLEALGARIDKGRLAADPVEMVAAGKMLEAAEGATGKKASLTAEAVLSEAIDLAKERGNPAELSLIAKLVGGSAGADLAAVAEAAKDKQPEAGEITRALDGELIVDNHSHLEVHVYVDGREVGHVPPHTIRYFHVHHAHHVVARDQSGYRWSVHFEHGYHRYRLVIREPRHIH